MSDLAPFVAAALRDKVMHELCEENKKLREETKKLKEGTSYWTLRCIDRKGSPVYATENLSQADVLDLLRKCERDEHTCQVLVMPMKPCMNHYCTFRYLCENIEFEITTSRGERGNYFIIEELDPILIIRKDDNANVLSIVFQFPDYFDFPGGHCFRCMAIAIPLGDPEVSARLDELKGGYYCNLDWAFTKTVLGDIMITFQNVILLLDVKYLIQQWRCKSDNDDADEDDG